MACHGLAQRHEQGLALAARGLFHRIGPIGPCFAIIRRVRQHAKGLHDELAIFRLDRGCCPVTKQRPPRGKIGLGGDIGARDIPEIGGKRIGHAKRRDLARYNRKWRLLQNARGERVKIVLIEFGGGRAELRQVKAVGQFLQRSRKHYRLGRAKPRHQAQQRHGRDPCRAQIAQG